MATLMLLLNQVTRRLRRLLLRSFPGLASTRFLLWKILLRLLRLADSTGASDGLCAEICPVTLLGCVVDDCFVDPRESVNPMSCLQHCPAMCSLLRSRLVRSPGYFILVRRRSVVMFGLLGDHGDAASLLGLDANRLCIDHLYQRPNIPYPRIPLL